MKKAILASVVICTIVYIVSCGKTTPGYSNCGNTPVAADSAALLAFAAKDTITPIKDTSGLYYQVIDTGTGTTPLPTSTISVTYVGKFMDGTIFDSTTNAASTNFVLNTLIQGWQIGLTKIQTGGRIKLLIPSALAYGCVGSGTTVAPNTPVFFDVTLVSVKQ